MMRKPKMKFPTQQKTTNLVKNAVTTMIKHISVIAIFVSLGIIALLYLGPEINLATKIVFKLAVPSVVLAVSITIVYELWITNGRRNAYEEPEYQLELDIYNKNSENLSYEAMQEYLDYERQRRYDTEYDRLSRIAEREKALLDKLQLNENKTKRDKWRVKLLVKHYYKTLRLRDNIRVNMPYEKSEEFDYLRYNLQDVVYKEYSPNDTKKHLATSRAKRYTKVYTFSLVGLNILSIGGSMGDFWVALIMTVLSAMSLMYAVVSGFSTGYHNIKVISTGVYKTANSFINQGIAYCKRTGKDLYYKGPTEFKLIEKLQPVETLPVLDGTEFESVEEMSIFSRAAREVDKTYKTGI